VAIAFGAMRVERFGDDTAVQIDLAGEIPAGGLMQVLAGEQGFFLRF
jgi:hypothetical protein